MKIWRFVGIVAALFLAWLSFAHATATVIRESNPSTALSLVPNDPVALANMVDTKALFSASPASVLDIKKSVHAGLRSQALSAPNMRNLALLSYAQGQINLANEALRLSEKLSRREVSAQIALIQYAVSQDSPAKALYHYDIALKTSPGSQANLFELMVAATGERVLLADFSKILARGPEWRFPFYAALILKAPSSENIALLYRSLLGTPGAFHEDATAGLIARLAADKNYSLAYSVYAQVKADEIKNPVSFNRTPRFQPFDWLLFDTSAASAFLAPSNDQKKSDFSLFFRAEANEDETLARKLTVLPMGQYKIRAEVRTDEPSMMSLLYWSIKCADGRELAGRDNADGLMANFTVPPEACNAQFIELNVSSKSIPVSGQIDKAILQRR